MRCSCRHLCRTLLFVGLVLTSAENTVSRADAPVELTLLQPTPPGPTPRLPDTNIEAPTPEPPTAPAAPTNAPLSAPFQPQTAPPRNDFPSVLTNSVFAAAPVTGYRATSSNTGSVVNVPTLGFPGTVNTFTSDLRKDQQALRIEDIIRDIGGAVQTNNAQLRPDSFFLRGLEMTSQNFRKNGFLDPTYTPRDFANVERIDVFKGPASIVYGSAQPAGTVNVITKKAVADRFAYGAQTYGSYGLMRYTADVNGMNRQGNVLVRVNTAYENHGSFRDFGFGEREFVSPTATWLIDSDTAFTMEGEFLHDRRRFDTGLVAVNGNPDALPRGRLMNDPSDRQVFHDYRGTLSLTHNFNDRWSVYVGGTTLFYDAPSVVNIPQSFFGINPTPGALYQGGPLNRSLNTATMFAEQNHALIANLYGEFNTGRFLHQTVLGTEQDWFVVNHDQFTTSIPGIDASGTFVPTNSDPFFSDITTSAFTFDNPGFRQNRHAIYWQDYTHITERLKVMTGVRWDHLDQTYNRSLQFLGFPIFGPVSTKQSFDQGTPRVGVVYEAIPDALSYYAVYTTSFNPSGGAIFAQTPNPLKPELGRIWEGGIKANVLDGLTFTLSGFHIVRQNVSTQISNFNVVQADTQRSQGVEMNMVGQLTERWSTLSNWAFTDVVQSDATGLISGRVRGVPLYTGNVWTRYNLIQERNRTVGVALGYIHVGQRRGDYTSPLVLPAYNRWDLGMYGRYGRWDLAGYIENIFDIRYTTGSISQYQVYPGAPTNFRLQIGTLF